MCAAWIIQILVQTVFPIIIDREELCYVLVYTTKESAGPISYASNRDGISKSC